MMEQSPTREQIEQLLEAAIHAPNHHKVEPWRFFVLAGKARNELGEIMASSLATRLQETMGAKTQTVLDKERNKPLRSPIVIVVASEHPTAPNIVDIENVEATAAAVQNMLLVAEELGLACMWRTGDAAQDAHIKQWLGLSTEDTIVAFLYVGYPAIPYTERQPTPFQAKTTWLGWEK